MVCFLMNAKGPNALIFVQMMEKVFYVIGKGYDVELHVIVHYRVVGMTQELGKLQTVSGENIDFQKYPLGSRLYLYPYHVSLFKANNFYV